MKSNQWLDDLLRVDFASSVGLYVLRDRIVMVRLRKALHSISLLAQEARDLPVSDEKHAVSGLTGWSSEDVSEITVKVAADSSNEQALKQAIGTLLPHCEPRRDAFYVSLAQDQVVAQEISLPAAATVDLKQVLDYEIERYVPFRRDDVFYDYVPIAKKGDRITVMLFAAPKKSVAPLLAALASFGIDVRGVEPTATAVANLLIFCARGTSGIVAAVGGHGNDLELIAVQNQERGWRHRAQLLYSYWLPQARFGEGARRELLQQCIKGAATVYAWGAGGQALNSPSQDQVRSEDLLIAGNHRLGGLDIAQASMLPAIGAALRGLREAPFGGNILTANLKDAERVAPLTYVNAALFVLLILGLGVWAATYPIKDELRLRQLRAENEKLAPAVKALQREEQELQKARVEQRYFAALDRRRGEVLRVLDELSKTVPTSAYLSNLRYRSNTVEVQGSAENASGLIPLLERSPVFENVGFNAPSNRGRDNRETFSLKAELEQGKTKADKADKAGSR